MHRANEKETISIHAPREGSDSWHDSSMYLGQNFYPRSPRGERRRGPGSPQHSSSHFYPRSPRGERRGFVAVHIKNALFLSTLPARGATGQSIIWVQNQQISIHAPREGSDLKIHTTSNIAERFLSTLPARGATPAPCVPWPTPKFLSTLPARGATAAVACNAKKPRFLSTLPARGATLYTPSRQGQTWISIHAPREGSDVSEDGEVSGHMISIHAPREGSDPSSTCLRASSSPFLSTLPARGATCFAA